MSRSGRPWMAGERSAAPRRQIAISVQMDEEDPTAAVQTLTRITHRLPLQDAARGIEDRCLQASLMVARDFLGHIHFADSNRRYPGAGHVPFGEVLEALRLIGYDDFITMEVKQEPDPTTAARRAAQYVRALLHTL
jgi:hypothetical protein